MSVPVPKSSDPSAFQDDDSSIAPSTSTETGTSPTYNKKDVPQPSRVSRFMGKVDRITSGVSRLGTAVATTWNPNHRHDEEWEKEIDRKIEDIRNGHRFRSFAPEREGNMVKWQIDGHDYFWALSEMIDRAESTIMILDWWLSPELQLRRPAAKYPEWRLDRLLQRKAAEGVRIYVQVYKEHALEDLHENIACQRHPDHSGGELVYYFSHHDKLCIVDNKYAALGGLDACFGRWDTHDHPLADVHPTKFGNSLFPGQDYNNSRVMDFQTVDKFTSNELAIQDTTRMLVDLVQHFCERWNFVKEFKYKHEKRMDWLQLPSPWADVYSETDAGKAAEDKKFREEHPHLSRWKEKGRQLYHPFHFPPSEEPRAHEEVPSGTARVQVVRSISDWSHGYLTEDSVQQAYIGLIREANHFIYIENQFFITAIDDTTPVKNQIGAALVERVVSAAKAGRPFKIFVLIPEVPAFPGDIQAESGLKAIMEAQYRSINRGGKSIFEKIRAEGFDPNEYISFWNLRSYDRINAAESVIKAQEEASGVKFHEAQVAMARLYVGEAGDQVDEDEYVYIEKPHDQATAAAETNKKKTAREAVKIPRTMAEARDIIDRFEAAGAPQGKPTEDNICQHALRTEGQTLLDEPWNGTEQEERDALVSELCYIHSKLMIVDDRRVIVGSANINDRSQNGDHDSEIAVVIEDTELVEMSMGGRKYMGSKLATSWRRALMREHLGLAPCQVVGRETAQMHPVPVPNEYDWGSPDDLLVEDPLGVDFSRLWRETAKENRRIFDRIFKTVPNSMVRNWGQYKDFVERNKGIKVSEAKARSGSRAKRDLFSVKQDQVPAKRDLVLCKARPSSSEARPSSSKAKTGLCTSTVGWSL
ncbi:hypothetical protein A1Q1_02371 [Trichosporon asahii var. asahii CBS 2479]|uniref:Phospholipase n=1 Tax=Trichosporon asahii var. asahii (strain ATCC 90039 / CBS 2479 / JCM 2466 / KCTC 7840 / NBRC 103889/ NCYC 2677 / UAMH 7654) TaxID=1186058 RepID=J6EVL8_TRIAS|nr:hypothetical protein A1Q1_02371 [Trichosporon asahii var. asahii CBS 2479]EJT48644.1 hypothetical protein A1Q1_02371 [Trichosporon asahii var. asahii CBS 2479]